MINLLKRTEILIKEVIRLKTANGQTYSKYHRSFKVIHFRLSSSDKNSTLNWKPTERPSKKWEVPLKRYWTRSLMSYQPKPESMKRGNKKSDKSVRWSCRIRKSKDNSSRNKLNNSFWTLWNSWSCTRLIWALIWNEIRMWYLQLETNKTKSTNRSKNKIQAWKTLIRLIL